MIKELCVENYGEAIKGQQLGADRIELCENLGVGGTTPSYGTIKQLKESLTIPFFVMIRPRGGNFVYNDDEIKIMEEDIKICKSLCVDGIVIGCLTTNNKIDYPLLKHFKRLAGDMQITFHKAIDELENPASEVLRLVEVGIDRILTSGGAKSAKDGKDKLIEMINISGNMIKIVVAGGVTKDNIEKISKIIPTNEYHGKLIV